MSDIKNVLILEDNKYAAEELMMIIGSINASLSVNTDELVHTARSSSACFPVFQCTLSAA